MQSTATIIDGDLIEQYKKRMIEELGLEKLPEEERQEIEAKIAELVNDRIINMVLIYLPDEKAKELDIMIETATQEEVMKFVVGAIPGIQEKIVNELMAIRDELVEMTAQIKSRKQGGDE